MIYFFALALLTLFSLLDVGNSEEIGDDTSRIEPELKSSIETDIDYRGQIPDEFSQGMMDESKDLMRKLLVPIKSTNIEGDPGSF